MAIAVGLAVLICGCTSTQTTAARLRLNDDRLRALSTPVRIQAGQTSTAITVASVTKLPGAVVVTLKNGSGAAVSDLPISVGYTLKGKTDYVNSTAASYFDNHIPAIAAHGSLTWVDAISARKFPKHATLFVRVGTKPSVAVGTVTPPEISATVDSTKAKATATTSVSARLTNESSIPQYQLPIYTLIEHDGQIVAAQVRSVTDLAAHAKLAIAIELPSGAASGAGDSVRVQAPATIFK